MLRARAIAICDRISCSSSRPTPQALVPFRDVIQVDGVAGARSRGAAREAVPHRSRRTRWTRPSGSARKARATTSATCAARSATRCSRSACCSSRISRGSSSHSARRTSGVGAGVAVVEYKEVGSPAMIRGEAGRDLPSHGRLWIDIATGRVLKTELQVEQPAVRAVITTTVSARGASRHRGAARDARAVHVRQRQPGQHRRDYGRFRRFDVSASEDIRTPIATHRRPWTGMTLVELPAGTLHDGQRVGRNRPQRRRSAARRRDHPAVPARAVRGDAAGMANGDGHRAEPFQPAAAPRCPVENVTYRRRAAVPRRS